MAAGAGQGGADAAGVGALHLVPPPRCHPELVARDLVGRPPHDTEAARAEPDLTLGGCEDALHDGIRTPAVGRVDLPEVLAAPVGLGDHAEAEPVPVDAAEEPVVGVVDHDLRDPPRQLHPLERRR